MSNDDDDNQKDPKKEQKEQENQIIDDDILEKIDKQTESSSNANTPPKVKSLNSQKTSPLSLSSGYDDDSSSSESYIDKLKKIFPNLDLD